MRDKTDGDENCTKSSQVMIKKETNTEKHIGSTILAHEKP